jgi:hypothetical protein
MASEDINQIFNQTIRGPEDHPFEILHEILRRTEAWAKPSEAELFRDGTLAMIVKSKFVECRTELTNALRLPDEIGGPNYSRDLNFQKRKCYSKFLFSLDSGGTVTIIPGVPNSNETYRAISYVWGPVATLKIPGRCTVVYALAAGLGTLNTQGTALEKDLQQALRHSRGIGHTDSRAH